MHTARTTCFGRNIYGLTRIGLALALVFVLSGCSPVNEQAGHRTRRSPLQAIDTHVHMVKLPVADKASESDLRFFATPIEERATVLQQEMEEAGVKMAFLMGAVGITPNKDDPLGIGESLEIAALVPGAKVIGGADPRLGLDQEYMAAVKARLKEERKNIVALKCYLGYVGGPDDPGYQPYYELAEEFDIPVIFHTGDAWGTRTDLRSSHPLGVDRVAWQHPNLRIVMAHVGVPWHKDAAEVAWKNDNVWLDLSGLLFASNEEYVEGLLKDDSLPDAVPGLVVTDLVNALTYMSRYDRLVYGSDWPGIGYPMASYRRFIETIIPQEHHQKVFRDNAEALFGVRVSDVRD